MSEFKTFFNLYLKYFLCLIILLAIIYIFYRNSFILGLIIGTTASAISSFVWHHNLLRAINSDALYVSSGMGIRFFNSGHGMPLLGKISGKHKLTWNRTRPDVDVCHDYHTFC